MSFTPENSQFSDPAELERVFGSPFSTPVHPPLAVVTQVFSKGWAQDRNFGLTDPAIATEYPILRFPPRQNLPLAAFINNAGDLFHQAPQSPIRRKKAETASVRLRRTLADHWHNHRLGHSYGADIRFLDYLTGAGREFRRDEAREFRLWWEQCLSDARSTPDRRQAFRPGEILEFKQFQDVPEGTPSFCFVPLLAWIMRSQSDWIEVLPALILSDPGSVDDERERWSDAVARLQREEAAVVFSMPPGGGGVRAVRRLTADTPQKLYRGVRGRDRRLCWIALPRFRCRVFPDQLRPQVLGSLKPPATNKPTFAEGYANSPLNLRMRAALDPSGRVFEQRSLDALFWVHPEGTSPSGRRDADPASDG
jgi:hypothetical protein